MTTLHDFHATTTTGGTQSLGDYAGQVVLVVNTASRCGLTPQLQGLQDLYAAHREQGLVVLGFPCNQFAGQAPGTGAEEGAFCQQNYGVEFPVFDTVQVNGSEAHPLFTWLTHERPGSDGPAIEWNFAKFLVDRDGQVVERFGPRTEPAALEASVEGQLAG